jgi:fatty acid desaturase
MSAPTTEIEGPSTASEQISAEDALGNMAAEPTPGVSQESESTGKFRVKWYRCKLPREELSKLNQRSDVLGFAQTLGFLGVITAASGAAIYSWAHWPWYATALLVFVNGHFWHFLINGFHELIHDSVFKTRWMNQFFLRVYSFLGWYNHHHFWASHTEHHKYTLHPPHDLEVTLPSTIDPKNWWKNGIINIRHPYHQIRGILRTARGQLDQVQWTQQLYPEDEPERRKVLFNWARIVLLGHLLIAGHCLAMGWWIVPLVITFPKMFGSWLQSMCNSTQHVGLQDEVADFRLCCRTIYLNPIFQFLYWHMNYHTEHHMYAGVPCYKLGRLHRLIKHEMPQCTNGLYETWKEILQIQERQKEDKSYVYVPELPEAQDS